MNRKSTNADLLGLARRVIRIEADAVAGLADRIGEPLLSACDHCYQCSGRVVVIGLGKSGHIGGKIAATLASTGTPAFFVHAAEASHGDMGMITDGDVVIAISNSGETREISELLPVIRRLHIPMITLTGVPESTLAKNATVNLDVSVAEEACPMNLAPTASTSAALAMGDALAIMLLERRGFGPEDFARTHPGGALGKRLLMTVEDLMHTGEALPAVQVDTSVREGLLEMTAKGLGITGVVNADGLLVGVFTDGDLRRALDQQIDVHSATMAQVMTEGGKTVSPDQMAVDALSILESHRITALLVVDDQRHLLGALNIHDLFRAGIV